MYYYVWQNWQPVCLLCQINPDHYVFSTFGVLAVSRCQPCEVLSLGEWFRQAVLHKAVSHIPFFKNYLIRRYFQAYVHVLCVVYHYQLPNNLSQCCLRSSVAFIYWVWKRMVIRKISYFHSFSSKHTGKICLIKISDESKTFTGRLWNGRLWNGEGMCPYFTVGRQFADVQNTIDNAKP